MMIVHEKADGADMEPIAEVATAVGCDVRALLEKAAAGEVMLHVALRPFTYTVATANGERHPSFQGGSATVQRWQLLPQYAAAVSNFREATVSHVPFPALENGPADTFYFVLSEPQTVTVEHVFVARGHVVCDAPVSESPAAASTDGARRHSTKVVARDVLDPAIELAQSRCGSAADDVAAVWAQLEALAQVEHPPLLAATSQGLKYSRGGVDAYLTRDALTKRLKRRA